MLANKYNTLLLTLVEMVQNAIDASATRVFIGIDADTRQVIVIDNGNGVDRAMFDEALASVAETKKTKTQIGRFGIGMISPLNKCNKFVFISQSITESHPVKWTFEARTVQRQKEQVHIPCVNLSSMPLAPVTFADQVKEIEEGKWRTMVHMIGLSTDRTVTKIDLDHVEEQIRTKLGHYMRKQGVEVRVMLVENGYYEVRDIKPRNFTGEPLGTIVYDGDEAGTVEIELYRARKVNGKRRGEVSVSEMDVIYPVTWKDFLNQARGGGWSTMSDAFEVLGSGYFEGTIRAKGISLTPERTRFEYNDAIVALYAVLDQWYNEVGKSHFETEKDLLRDERYYQIGLAVMSSMREMLRLPEFEGLVQGIQEHLNIGHIGEGHGNGRRRVGDDKQPSTRVGQGGAGRKRASGNGQSGGRSPDGKTRDGDVPFGVIGKGKRRTEVKDDSLGLWIEVTDFEYSTRLWEFDRKRGLLSFNSSNVLWADLDGEYSKRRTTKNDRMLEHLQKWVILKVLVLLTLPEEEFEAARELVDRETKAYVHAFIKM
jgi:hypothetical protein